MVQVFIEQYLRTLIQYKLFIKTILKYCLPQKVLHVLLKYLCDSTLCSLTGVKNCIFV